MASRMGTIEGPPAPQRRRRRWAWAVAGASVGTFLVAAMVVARGGTRLGHHPQPRPAAERPDIQMASRYSQYARVAQTYKMATAVPAVLDGLYCHCACAEHSGHYSLLDCFTSDHAAHCDICLSEAVIAYQMHLSGASLAAIRAEIDRTYGS